ncbi:GNAT family N-acetyltransferase [Pseudoalteromonas luteoviolacea]|uniref:N-acetyltransferase domain-containing protein n=1 Tax=Pseudoalteromonas luteoviolacea S4054 TaxID=1129367 RepID=A0A0F6AFX2_9GAMM|nr:GNAT family N-acetyltransferase [Pseudoalteromonas luteoviolacea]AOT08334.1 hypothetical protein S4054249_10980 [Pseudoalteromonas luteoviolacea]AOT13250.1 hypothetical protein S40542_10955 [Pseudoalteromonas luteoviolacea]AOT18163.1 hypothetical protein S4054_10955 [Pseudoalteromonas luteoviolacea]KKE84279.1 hypothetical protein N479_10290 [Pseudoalteromonas luteoviolacea S4054]KZN76116.1 hypothetical protein N481_07125 [Pseudoalteromonas luteoviolacea S4047-1]
MKIRTIEEKDWNCILDIQEKSYQEVGIEDLAVLKSKNDASPDTCFVCVSNDGEIFGYVLAHPWCGVAPPKLFESLPYIENCDHLYLHDMAISPHSKGKGVGRALASKLIDVAKNKSMTKISLVAVQGSQTFWTRVGFKEVKGVEVCSSYGEQAVLMENVLNPQESTIV